jgi:hypothetical protein
MASDVVMYQIKATLNGIKPPVWRRLLVPGSYSLKDVHDVLQIAFNWTNSHLHQFVVKKKHYGLPYDDFGEDIANEKRFRLDDVLKAPRDSMVYEYDFGDGWEHKIVLEKVHNNPGGHLTPLCMDGARACPPDDCGGPWGYDSLLNILSNPAHPEHQDMLEWAGGLIDPEHFDIAEINSILSKMKRKGLVKSTRTTGRKPPVV